MELRLGRVALLAAGVMFLVWAWAQAAASAPVDAPSRAPVVDYHHHLLSPAGAALLNRSPGAHFEPITAEDAIAQLDSAGVRRAIILSDAYFFDGVEAAAVGVNDRAAMRAENDWTAAQAARFPDRLIPFCAVNPLKDYAVAEIDRCARDPAFRGLKLHFDTSGVDLLDPVHVAKVRRVFAAADRHRWAIQVHVGTRRLPAYGGAHARVMVDELVPAAPHVPVVIAHFWGGAAFSDAAMAEYARGVAKGQKLYFDVSNGLFAAPRQAWPQMAKRMRQIGVRRFLFGTDSPVLQGHAYRDVWPLVRERLGLTDAEAKTMAGNVLPYARANTHRQRL